eukprot:10235926-Lingulodinium_polyedra.AAC.1
MAPKHNCKPGFGMPAKIRPPNCQKPVWWAEHAGEIQSCRRLCAAVLYLTAGPFPSMTNSGEMW